MALVGGAKLQKKLPKDGKKLKKAMVGSKGFQS